MVTFCPLMKGQAFMDSSQPDTVILISLALDPQFSNLRALTHDTARTANKIMDFIVMVIQQLGVQVSLLMIKRRV